MIQIIIHIIIQKYHTQDVVLGNWKKGKIILVHNENNKQLANNYQSVSL